MLKKLLFTSLFCLTFTASADPVFKIDVGNDYLKYTNAELQRRVWELERAVFQLQQRVFQLEGTSTTAAAAETWICKIDGWSNATYTATGVTKAVAESRVTEKCRNQDKDKGFFCSKAKCEQ